MKCPKCGFQSFNYLANCKKCGRDLSDLRDKYGLGDPVLPPPATDAEGAAVDLFAAPDSESETSAEGVISEPEPQGALDADLAGDFDEWEDLDPELAATLDPDADWPAEPFAEDASVEGGAASEAQTPDLFAQTPPVSECAEGVEPAVVAAPDGPEPAGAEVNAVEESGDQNLFEAELQGEGEVDLDEWLLDGEEPAWRRPSPEEEALPLAEEADLGEEPAAAVAEDPCEEDEDISALSEVGDGPGQTALPFCEDAEPAGPARASWFARGVAALLDVGILSAALVLFVLAGEYLRQGGGAFNWPRPQDLSAQTVPYFLVFFGLAFGYFTLFHYLSGQTLGKMVCRVVVVDIDGGPLQLSQAFLRSVGGLLCLLSVGLGFIWALFEARERGWNDLLAGSVVAAVETGISEDAPVSGS